MTVDSSTNGQGLISVVLCCYNGAQTVGEQLAALAQQDYTGRWELVFVDDGSNDESLAIADSWRDRLPLRTVRTNGSGHPVGLANARNVGGYAARGDVLLFCDADDVADPGWISALAEATREAAAVGGFLEEALLNEPSLRGWRLAATPGDLPVALGRRFAVGANCGVQSAVFHAIGGFDGQFTSCGDEIDFFFRVQLAGHELRYVPAAVMHYRHRDSLKQLARQWYSYGICNAVLYRKFRHLGIRRTSVGKTLSVIYRMFRTSPALRRRESRGYWVMICSLACGQAVGSMRNRVWYLG